MNTFSTEVLIVKSNQANQTYKKNLRIFKDYVKNIDVNIKNNFIKQLSTMSKIQRPLKTKLNNILEEKQERLNFAEKLEKQFVVKCQTIIKNDILKWEQYQQFYSKLFIYFDKKIIEEKAEIKKKLQKIRLMKEQLKIYLKNNIYVHDKNQFQTIKQQNIKTESTVASRLVRRLKTQISLPQLKSQRLKTTVEMIPNKMHSYMNPIGIIKVFQNSMLPLLNQLLQWLRKYKQNSQYNWFQKIIFTKRNYLLLQQYLKEHSENRATKVSTKKLTSQCAHSVL